MKAGTDLRAVRRCEPPFVLAEATFSFNVVSKLLSMMGTRIVESRSFSQPDRSENGPCKKFFILGACQTK